MTGRWSYASGAHFATWVALSGVVTDETGGVVEAVMGFAPASELIMEDTWHTTGMRGTGSNTWLGEDIFVPDHRLVSMIAGRQWQTLTRSERTRRSSGFRS